MKTTFLRPGVMLAIALLTNGGLLLADDVQLTSNYDEADAVATSQPMAATYATDAAPIKPQAQAADGAANAGCCQGSCSKCGNQGNSCNKCGKCGDCCGCRSWGPYSEKCPQLGSSFFTGVDSFRGVTNGTYQNNNGAVTGFNLGGRLLEDYGIGWQVGASYGVYNFNGSASPGSQLNEQMQQVFLTTGIFHRANSNRRISWGIVQDWMFSDNFGVFGNSPTLGQVRGQIAYAVSDRNEFGAWATFYDRTATRGTGALGTPVSYQAINQGNLFWHHKYAACGADSWIYVGIPLDQRIAQTQTPAGSFPVGGYGGSIGSMILGTNWTLPITDRLSGYANVMYMKASAHEGVNTSGAFASAQDYWNIGCGLAWYPGRAARSATVAGRQWMPYMPVANNSSFLVDATKTE